MAALSSAVVLPSAGEGAPRITPTVEATQKGDFKASALALKASAANSVLARGILACVDDLVKTDRKLPRLTCNTLKKISLAAAFTADSSLDSVQFNAKAFSGEVQLMATPVGGGRGLPG